MRQWRPAFGYTPACRMRHSTKPSHYYAASTAQRLDRGYCWKLLGSSTALEPARGAVLGRLGEAHSAEARAPWPEGCCSLQRTSPPKAGRKKKHDSSWSPLASICQISTKHPTTCFDAITTSARASPSALASRQCRRSISRSNHRASLVAIPHRYAAHNGRRQGQVVWRQELRR